jgi:hypothetical protein
VVGLLTATIAIVPGFTTDAATGDCTKACGHLAHSDFQGGEVDHGSVALIGFLVSGGDPAKCFEAAEEVLHEMPPAISMEITVNFLLPVRFGRDHRYRTSIVELRTQPVSVEGLVAEEHAELDVLDQRFHPDEVVTLTGQQNEAR